MFASFFAVVLEFHGPFFPHCPCSFQLFRQLKYGKSSPAAGWVAHVGDEPVTGAVGCFLQGQEHGLLKTDVGSDTSH